MAENRCAYEGCDESTNSLYDENLCVFHAPKEKKGITVEQFNDLIWRRLNSRCFNFRGFIFPGDISFRGECKKSGGPIAFAKDADFSAAQFLGDADFNKAEFSGNADFRGAQFSGYADFRGAQFSRYANFSKAQFSGYADFSKAQFSGYAYFSEGQFSGYANFSKAQFSGSADFNEARFSGDADFSKAQFSGYAYFSEGQFSGYADFSEAQFSAGVVFSDAQFSGYAYFSEGQFSGYADFGEAQFSGYASFSQAQFSGDADFSKAQFLRKAYFDKTQFKNKAIFENIGIKIEMKFENITLEDKSRFYFRSPQFIDDRNNKTRIIFDAVQFNPFGVYFENIRRDTGEGDACFIFRYCQLKDVYFTDNNMSLFSFYKSSFDQARFSSSEWGIEKDRILFFRFKRHNVIPEERFLDEISQNKDDKEQVEKLRDEYKIEDLNDHEDIASLYRRMKTALDNTKDYQQASWFYFNEFEMKRRALKERIESSKPKWNIFQWKPFVKIHQTRKKIFSKYLLYFCYKTFAGFGEKPLWSFIWFWAFTAIFAFGHMVFGLKYFPGGVVTNEYKFFSFLSDFSVGNFLKEFASAFGYSLSQAIPKNYIPYKISNLNPINPFGITWSILNTITLLILLVFIAIGLKRHFRRF